MDIVSGMITRFIEYDQPKQQGPFDNSKTEAISRHVGDRTQNLNMKRRQKNVEILDMQVSTQKTR